MASATGTLAAPSPLSHATSLAWLRNPQFDFTLIVVVAGWALAAGVAVVVEPYWFWPILFLDVWLLGYTHVVSTFTRLAFDRESFRQHRLLLSLCQSSSRGSHSLWRCWSVSGWWPRYISTRSGSTTRVRATASRGCTCVRLARCRRRVTSCSMASSTRCRSGASFIVRISSPRHFSACQSIRFPSLRRCSGWSAPWPR